MSLPRLKRSSLPQITIPILLLLLVLPTTINGLSDGPERRGNPSPRDISQIPTNDIRIPPTMASPATKTTTTTKTTTKTTTTAAAMPIHEDFQRLVDDPLPEMPLLPITSETTVRACRDMPISPALDVFVCSYPKSGTTWTQNIVVRLLWEIANSNTANRNANTNHRNAGADINTNSNTNTNAHHPLPDDWHLSHSAPFYEVDQYWRLRTQGGDTRDGNGIAGCDGNEPISERCPAQTPIRIHDNGRETAKEYRVFNTHLRPNQLPPGAKCVYVVRDPFDVMISFYHHLSNQSVEDGGYTGTFEEFCNEFLDGTILYGKWQDHIEAWLGGDAGGTPRNNFLVLHYEDMKSDLEKETKRLARFLLEEDDRGLAPDDEFTETLVSRVVPHCTFAAMKTERHRYTPLTVSWRIDPKTGKPYDEFVRKGNVGEGNAFLRMDSSLELRDRWMNHDAPIARSRWIKAGVDSGIIDRYLS